MNKSVVPNCHQLRQPLSQATLKQPQEKGKTVGIVVVSPPTSRFDATTHYWQAEFAACVAYIRSCFHLAHIIAEPAGLVGAPLRTVVRHLLTRPDFLLRVRVSVRFAPLSSSWPLTFTYVWPKTPPADQGQRFGRTRGSVSSGRLGLPFPRGGAKGTVASGTHW